MPVIVPDHVTVIAVVPDEVHTPSHISCLATVPSLSAVTPATRLHDATFPPDREDTLRVVELHLAKKTRADPTFEDAVRLSEVRAVPVAESRFPMTVIAIDYPGSL